MVSVTCNVTSFCYFQEQISLESVEFLACVNNNKILLKGLRGMCPFLLSTLCYQCSSDRWDGLLATGSLLGVLESERWIKQRLKRSCTKIKRTVEL